MGFSGPAANTRLRQAATAALRTDSDFPAPAMLSQRFSAWHDPNFAAASSERHWVFTLRGRKEELRESWCLLGFAFPGSEFMPGIHLAMLNEADTVTNLQQRAWPSMALYAYYHLLG